MIHKLIDIRTGLAISIAANIILGGIIIMPSGEVQTDNSLNDELISEVVALKDSLGYRKIKVSLLERALEKAKKKDTIIQEKTVIRYETIYQIPDSTRDDSVLAVLRRRADAREKASR